MGYYTGNGVVTGGNESASLRSTGPAVGGAYYFYQRTRAVTTTKLGVSLSVAQAARGGAELAYWQWPGGVVEPGARGTRTAVSFSQIGGSNLYQLAVTNETVQCRGKQGTYDSGWVS